MLLSDGYAQERAEELAFYLAQSLRDAVPLLDILEKMENHSTEDIMDAIHLFIANLRALEEAKKLLMYEDER